MHNMKHAALSLIALIFVFGCAAQQPLLKQKPQETTAATEEQVRAELATLKTELEEAEEERKAQKAEEERKAAEARAAEERKTAEAKAAREAEEARLLTAHVGYMSYRVWRAEWSNRLPLDGFLDSRPNAKWLLVELSARNNDRKARAIPPFALVDEQGREYESASQGALLPSGFGILESLNPSVTKQGLVVFDVPQDRTYKLKVSGGYWSKEDGYIPILPK